MTEEEYKTEQVESKESIDLKLNAKGLYYWEIKVKELLLCDATIERLKDIEKKLKESFKNNVMIGDLK